MLKTASNRHLLLRLSPLLLGVLAFLPRATPRRASAEIAPVRDLTQYWPTLSRMIGGFKGVRYEIDHNSTMFRVVGTSRRSIGKAPASPFGVDQGRFFSGSGGVMMMVSDTSGPVGNPAGAWTKPVAMGTRTAASYVSMAGGAGGLFYGLDSTGKLWYERYNLSSKTWATRALLAEGLGKSWLIGGTGGVLYVLQEVAAPTTTTTTTTTSPTADPDLVMPTSTTAPTTISTIIPPKPDRKVFRFVDTMRNGTRNGTLTPVLVNGTQLVLPKVSAATVSSGTGTQDIIWATRQVVMCTGTGLQKCLPGGNTSNYGTAPADALTPKAYNTGAAPIATGFGTPGQTSAQVLAALPAVPGSTAKRLCATGETICFRGSFAASTTAGKLKASGDFTVETFAGDWTVGNASLDIDIASDKPYVSGSVTANLPNITALSGSIKTSGRAAATIAVGFGGAFTVSLGDGADEKQVPTSSDKFYIYASFSGEAKATILGQEITFGGGTKLLFEPTAPTIYIDHTLAQKTLELLGIYGWQNPVLGFSMGTCISHTLTNGLVTATDRNAKETPTVCGNLLVKGSGTIPLKVGELSGDGAIVVDLDANDDGQLGDMQLGADLTVTLSVAIPKTPLSVPVTGTVSMLYTGPQKLSKDNVGRFRFAAASVSPTKGMFTGALAKWDTQSATTSLQLDLSSTAQYADLTYNAIKVAGFSLGGARVTADSVTGKLTAKGDLDLAAAKINVYGENLMGTLAMTLTGTGGITLFGYPLAGVTVAAKMGSTGAVAVTASAATANVFGNQISLTGSFAVDTAGKVSATLTGKGSLAIPMPDGSKLQVASGNVSINNSGVTVDFNAGLFGLDFFIKGQVNANSSFSLTGTASISGSALATVFGPAASWNGKVTWTIAKGMGGAPSASASLGGSITVAGTTTSATWAIDSSGYVSGPPIPSGQKVDLW